MCHSPRDKTSRMRSGFQHHGEQPGFQPARSEWTPRPTASFSLRLWRIVVLSSSGSNASSSSRKSLPSKYLTKTHNCEISVLSVDSSIASEMYLASLIPSMTAGWTCSAKTWTRRAAVEAERGICLTDAITLSMDLSGAPFLQNGDHALL